jgi:hypothetical protein
VVYDLLGVVYDSSSSSAFLRQRRWIPDVVTVSGGTASTYDAVNCVEVQGTGAGGVPWLGIVENPSYLSTSALPLSDDFPGGITEAALEAWCGSGDCLAVGSARRWLCNDALQTNVRPEGGGCTLRRIERATYSTYTDPQGNKRGTYSSTSRPELVPDCYSWVRPPPPSFHPPPHSF